MNIIAKCACGTTRIFEGAIWESILAQLQQWAEAHKHDVATPASSPEAAKQ